MKIKSSIDSINLESINNNARELSKHYIFNLDAYVIDVASILMILVNLFWILLEMFGSSSRASVTVHFGMGLGVLLPFIALIYLFRRKEDDYSSMRALVLFFQLSVIAVTTLLTLHSKDTSGISLAMFWLVICAFSPMVNLADSIIVMTLLFLSTFLPALLLHGPEAVNRGNIIIAFCVVIA
ncbi:MAG: hypothetical protein J6U27_06210, partial [Spirochaetales bacterium]|nr:hypothetical protein [Spirochaetales bacterium]